MKPSSHVDMKEVLQAYLDEAGANLAEFGAKLETHVSGDTRRLMEDVLECYAGALELLDTARRELPENGRAATAARAATTRDVVFVLGLDGEILCGSSMAFAVMGYRADELRGRSVYSLMDPGESDDLCMILMMLNGARGAGIRTRLLIRLGDGSICLMQATLRQIFQGNGRPGFLFRGRLVDAGDGASN